MDSATRDALFHGVDIGGGWRAYGYGVYHEDDGWRVFLRDIKPTEDEDGDEEDTIEDWSAHILERYGDASAGAFENFAYGILRNPWPNKAAIRKRLIAFGVRHKAWPPGGRPNYEDR